MLNIEYLTINLSVGQVLKGKKMNVCNCKSCTYYNNNMCDLGYMTYEPCFSGPKIKKLKLSIMKFIKYFNKIKKK